MNQVWLLLATLGISATISVSQYSGNRRLDTAIDKAWQRHGGGFLNQESYAHDAAKERKISTTIGSFGGPLTPYLKGQYDVPEYSSIYIPEVPLADSEERFLEINHEPLRAIEGSLHGSRYINKYGPNYDRDVLLVRDDDTFLHKEYSEYLPHDVLYREHPTGKERLSIVKHVHPSAQEEYLVEKIRKDPYSKDHHTALRHKPKGDHIVVETIHKDLPKSGHIEVKTQEKIYKDTYAPHDEFHGRDHLIVKTEEKVIKDKIDPTMDRFYVDKIHRDVPVRDHIVHETVYKDLKHPGTKVIEKEHAVLSSREKLYKDEYMPQEHILREKLYRDPYGKDSIALTTHEKIYKDVYDSADHDGHQVSVKTEEIYQPKLGGYGKDHLTVKTQEKIYRDTPLSNPDKVTVENIYRTHTIAKPELYDEPHFGYEKEHLDEIGLEYVDEKIIDSRKLQSFNERHVPVEERVSTFRTRPTNRGSWPRKEPCDPLNPRQENFEC